MPGWFSQCPAIVYIPPNCLTLGPTTPSFETRIHDPQISNQIDATDVNHKHYNVNKRPHNVTKTEGRTPNTAKQALLNTTHQYNAEVGLRGAISIAPFQYPFCLKDDSELNGKWQNNIRTLTLPAQSQDAGSNLALLLPLMQEFKQFQFAVGQRYGAVCTVLAMFMLLYRSMWNVK